MVIQKRTLSLRLEHGMLGEGVFRVGCRFQKEVAPACLSFQVHNIVSLLHAEGQVCV